MIEFLESRTLLSAAVSMGDAAEAVFSKGHPLAVTDADGTQTIFALSGAGQGTVRRTTDGIDLLLTGTRSASKVTSKSVGGDGLFIIGSLSVDGAIGALQLPRADLTGALTTGVYVGSLSLHRIDHAGTVPLVRGMDFGTIKLASTSRVDLYVDSVQSLRLQGDLLDSSLRFKATTDKKANGIKSLVVTGSIERTHIDALADIGSVTANAMRDSTVMAGVRYEYISPGVFEQTLPVAVDYETKSFTGHYVVGNVTIRGDRQAVFSFENSRIGAYLVKKVSLKQVNPDNGGKEFGVAGYDVRRVTARYPKDVDWRSTDLKFRQSLGPMTTRLLDPSGSDGGGTSSGFRGTLGGYDPEASYWKDVTHIGVTDEVRHKYGFVQRYGADTRIVGFVDASSGTEKYIFQAIDGETVRASAASLPNLLREIVGSAGTSIKLIVNPDTLTLLSTLEGPEITIYRSKPATGTPDGLARAMGGSWYGGKQVVVMNSRPVANTGEPILIGQRFQPGQLLNFYYLGDGSYQAIDAAGNVAYSASSIANLIVGEGIKTRGVHQYHPHVDITNQSDVVVYGLYDGGSAVFFHNAPTHLIDKVGNLTPLPAWDLKAIESAVL